jgi:hypothetical protein
MIYIKLNFVNFAKNYHKTSISPTSTSQILLMIFSNLCKLGTTIKEMKILAIQHKF